MGKTLYSLLLACRPKQQIKNILVLVPVIFSGYFTDLIKVKMALLAFIAFCLASSAVYIVNDIVDRERDRAHVFKKNRPVASGALGVTSALFFCAILTLASALISWFVSPWLLLVALLYIALVCSYSVWLKNFVILDVFSIALGFVLRILAGIIAINAIFSPWIIGATFFLALFLASMKRESEYIVCEQSSLTSQRKVLEKYNPEYVRMLSNGSTTATLVIYFMYTALEVKNMFFIITVLPVAYGIFRFIWIVRLKKIQSDDTADILFEDKPLLWSVILYGLLVVILLYLS